MALYLKKQIPSLDQLINNEISQLNNSNINQRYSNENHLILKKKILVIQHLNQLSNTMNFSSQNNSFYTSKNYKKKSNENKEINFSCDRIKQYRLKIKNELKEKQLLFKKTRRKNNKETGNFYLNAILSRKKTLSDNSLSTIKLKNVSFNEYIKPKKFLQQKSFINSRETIQQFNKLINNKRKGELEKYYLNEYNKRIIEKYEKENTNLEIIRNKIATNKILLEKYFYTLSKYLIELNKIIEEESEILNNYRIEHNKIKSEVKYIQYKIDKKKNKKKFYCRFKALLLQMKYNSLELNNIDEKILEEYGMENCKKLQLNKNIIYYDDTNDNNIGEYIERKNPPIFKDLSEFERFFENKEYKILDYCQKYFKKNHSKLLEEEKMNLLKEENKISEKEIMELIYEKEKNLLNLKYHYKKLFSIKDFFQKHENMINIKPMNNIHQMLKKKNFFISQYMFLHYGIKNNFDEKQDKINNIIIKNLKYLEKVINILKDKDKQYKKTNEDIKVYDSIKNQYLLIKNLINNRKLIEEEKIKKKIEKINSKKRKYIYKQNHKVCDNLNWLKRKNNKNKIQNQTVFEPQKDNINELENYIKYKE